MILITLCSIFAIVASQSEVQSSCSQLKETFKKMCPNQAVGLMTNREKIEKIISSTLKEVVDTNVQQNSLLGERMAKLEERLAKMKNSTEYLPIVYKGKRYWIESRPLGMDCNKAKDVCAENGGKPANIYSEEHYYLLMGQLRILAPADGVMTAWTGLTYNQKTDKVSLSDGSPAPFLLWAPRSPKYDGCISLFVRQNRLSPDQHMHAMKPDWVRTGVVCEK